MKFLHSSVRIIDIITVLEAVSKTEVIATNRDNGEGRVGLQHVHI